MEFEGVDCILKRFVKFYNLWYIEYYGDGESKSFSKVKVVYLVFGIMVEKKNVLVMCRKGWV